MRMHKWAKRRRKWINGQYDADNGLKDNTIGKGKRGKKTNNDERKTT